MPLLCATLRNFYELPTSVVDVGSYNMSIAHKQLKFHSKYQSMLGGILSFEEKILTNKAVQCVVQCMACIFARLFCF